MNKLRGRSKLNRSPSFLLQLSLLEIDNEAVTAEMSGTPSRPSLELDNGVRLAVAVPSGDAQYLSM
jgi:hypothetical protein